MKTKSIRMLVALTMAAILFASCSRSRNEAPTDPAVQKAATPGGRASAVAAVKVQEVQPGSLSLSTQAMGVLRSRHEIPLSPQIGGSIVEKVHDVGDAVSAGETILLIDPEPYALALQQAQAGLASAQVAYDQAARNYQRDERLKASDDISQVELENAELGERTAKASLQMAEAGLKLAERNVRLTRICSPVAGHVADLNVQLGQQVSPGMPLGLVVALDQMEVEVGLSEREIACIEPGIEVRVQIDALPGKSFCGKVRAVGVAGLEPGKTFPVIVSVDNSSGLLRPGMSALLELVYACEQNVLFVPRDALVGTAANQPALFVVDRQVAFRRNVTLGAGDDRWVIVNSGLAPGEMLVVEGQEALHDSVNVKIL